MNGTHQRVMGKQTRTRSGCFIIEYSLQAKMTIKKYKYIYIYIWIHLFKMILFFFNNNNKDWRPSDEGRPIFEKKAVSMNQTSAARLSVICRPL